MSAHIPIDIKAQSVNSAPPRHLGAKSIRPPVIRQSAAITPATIAAAVYITIVIAVQ
jgi:hypothetical protein